MSSVRRRAAKDFTGQADSGFDVRGRRTSEYDFSLPDRVRNDGADEKNSTKHEKSEKTLDKAKSI